MGPIGATKTISVLVIDDHELLSSALGAAFAAGWSCHRRRNGGVDR